MAIARQPLILSGTGHPAFVEIGEATVKFLSWVLPPQTRHEIEAIGGDGYIGDCIYGPDANHETLLRVVRLVTTGSR